MARFLCSCLVSWMLAMAVLCSRSFANAQQSKTITPQAPADTWSVPAQYRGKAVSSGRHNIAVKAVALTFDDGPSANITPQVLALLRQHHAHATFFVMGQNVRQYPQLVTQAVAEGHVVGCHSYTHAIHPSQTVAQSEMKRTRELVQTATGHDPVLFRPPYGDVKSEYATIARQEKDTIILWSVSGADTATRDYKMVRDNVTEGINPGDIVLMHDSSGKAHTAKALPEILTRLEQRGFSFVTIPEMLRLSAAVAPIKSTRRMNVPAQR